MAIKLLEDRLRGNALVYGPYLRKDNRKHVIIYLDGKHQTMSFPKWVVEQYLCRFLSPDETIDHINRDHTDDRLDNFRIISFAAHISEDTRHVRLVEITCIGCGSKSCKSGRDLRNNSRNGKAGPFCSRRCSGIYGKAIQLGDLARLPAQPDSAPEDREYYYATDKAESSHAVSVASIMAGDISHYNSILGMECRVRRVKQPKVDRQFVPRPIKTPRICDSCATVISNKAQRCKSCAARMQPTKVTWPSLTELQDKLKLNPNYSALARELGVSDNAIRKHMKNRAGSILYTMHKRKP